MTTTQGEHAQTELAHELFAAAQLAPGEGIEDAVNRIAAALTAAPADNEVLPLLIRDIANDLGKTAIEVMQALRDTGHGNTSVNTAVTRSMAASLRKHFETAPAQPAAPQGVAYAELPEPTHKIAWDSNMARHDVLLPRGDQNGAYDVFSVTAMRDFADRTHALRASHGQAPQGVAYAELPKDVIRAVFIENGFTVKEGQTDLKQYVYDAADALLDAARKQGGAQ